MFVVVFVSFMFAITLLLRMKEMCLCLFSSVTVLNATSFNCYRVYFLLRAIRGYDLIFWHHQTYEPSLTANVFVQIRPFLGFATV